MFAKIASSSRPDNEAFCVPYQITTSTKEAGGKFLDSMLVMETGDDNPAEGTADGFWMMTADRLLHYSQDENTKAITNSMAEMLKLLDLLLNRDNLRTLDELLPKNGAAKGTASRLMMDYINIDRGSENSMYVKMVDETDADDEDAGEVKKELAESKQLLDKLLLDTIQLISIVTNPFDPNDPEDNKRMMGKGEKYKGTGIRHFVTDCCGESSNRIVEVIAGFLSGQTVTKKTISDLVAILSEKRADGTDALVSRRNRDKAKAFILGVFALCNDNADIMEFRHCALALGNFDDTVIEIIKSFAHGSYAGEKKSEDVGDYDLGDGFLAKLFAQFDTDRSGSIDFIEFQELLRYINVNIAQERAVQIFSRCDTDGNKTLTYDEFEKSFALLAHEVATAALQSLGLSNTQIYSAIGGGTLILGGLCAFIFLGMGAFTENSTFGSMVNSGFCLLSGGAVAANEEGGIDADNPKISDYLEEKVSEALEALNPE